MIYSFETEELLNVYDKVKELLALSGSFVATKAMCGIRSGAYDSQDFFRILDFLVQKKRIKCINKGVAAQDEVYVRGDK